MNNLLMNILKLIRQQKSVCGSRRTPVNATIFAWIAWLTFTAHAQTFPWEAPMLGPLAVQTDGKVLISGRFERIDGVPRTNLARLNLDGSLDRSFDPAGLERSFDQGINWLALQSDGKILVAGWS